MSGANDRQTAHFPATQEIHSPFPLSLPPPLSQLGFIGPRAAAITDVRHAYFIWKGLCMVGDSAIVPALKNLNKMDFMFKAFKTSDLEFY